MATLQISEQTIQIQSTRDDLEEEGSERIPLSELELQTSPRSLGSQRPSRSLMPLESSESARVSRHRDETWTWLPRREPAEIPGQNRCINCLSERYSIPSVMFFGGIICTAGLVIAVIILSSVLPAQITILTIENRTYMACSEAWIGFGSKCYYFSDDTRNWTFSALSCASQEANLVQIETQEELKFLRRYKDNVDHWIGFITESLKHNGKQTTQTRCNDSFVDKVAGECPYLNDNGDSFGRIYIERKWICSKPKKNIYSCQTPLKPS